MYYIDGDTDSKKAPSHSCKSTKFGFEPRHKGPSVHTFNHYPIGFPRILQLYTVFSYKQILASTIHHPKPSDFFQKTLL